MPVMQRRRMVVVDTRALLVLVATLTRSLAWLDTMNRLIKRAFLNGQHNIKLKQVMKNIYNANDLFTARAAILYGDPVPEAVVAEMMKLFGEVLPAPPAHLWPRGNTVIMPDAPTGGPEPITTPQVTKPKVFEWLVPMGKHFPIIGQGFTRAEFIEYLRTLPDSSMTWNPQGCTLHHTYSPDLAIRPQGFTPKGSVNYMLNMRSGYMNDLGWDRGPHIYTDDDLIWIFSPLTHKGIHARSFNSTHFGIECLGDFDRKDDPYSGRGAKCWDNALFAAAALNWFSGDPSAQNNNFHRDDPKTNKTCPGTKVDKRKTLLRIAEHRLTIK